MGYINVKVYLVSIVHSYGQKASICMTMWYTYRTYKNALAARKMYFPLTLMLLIANLANIK